MYDAVISLGYFCGPALEMKRIGRRQFSLPFDWLITDFDVVLKYIETNFEGFLREEKLCQYRDNPNYYYDSEDRVHFYHDFDGYKSLSSQIEAVQQKYDRRIKRLYECLNRSNIFVRYIRDQEESDFISSNFERITKALNLSETCSILICVYQEGINPPKSFKSFSVPCQKADDHFMLLNKDIEDYIVSRSGGGVLSTAKDSCQNDASYNAEIETIFGKAV